MQLKLAKKFKLTRYIIKQKVFGEEAITASIQC